MRMDEILIYYEDEIIAVTFLLYKWTNYEFYRVQTNLLRQGSPLKLSNCKFIGNSMCDIFAERTFIGTESIKRLVDVHPCD